MHQQWSYCSLALSQNFQVTTTAQSSQKDFNLRLPNSVDPFNLLIVWTCTMSDIWIPFGLMLRLHCQTCRRPFRTTDSIQHGRQLESWSWNISNCSRLESPNPAPFWLQNQRTSMTLQPGCLFTSKQKQGAEAFYSQLPLPRTYASISWLGFPLILRIRGDIF